MTECEIKKAVKRFKKEFGLQLAEYQTLCTAAEKLGYTVVAYNHVYNDDDVKTLIDALSLTKQTESSKAFAYADTNYRLLFIHEDLSEKEKTIVLSHEIGHIYLNHMTSSAILGKDVQEEYEANEFSHHLINSSLSARLKDFYAKHKKGVLCVLTVLLVAVVAAGICYVSSIEKQYYGEYYTTTTGKKYHKEGCVFVKDKNNVERLTEEQFNSGEYEPCQMCLP